MNLMELFVKIGVDDQASSKVKSISNTIGKGLSSAANIGTSAVAGTAKVIGTTLVTAAKAGAVALGTASAALIKLGKDAVGGYADYEQLVGGIETLFKSSAETIEGYANQDGNSWYTVSSPLKGEYNLSSTESIFAEIFIYNYEIIDQTNECFTLTAMRGSDDNGTDP